MEEMTAGELQAAAERLMEAASTLERTVARMAEQQVALVAEAESQGCRIVATVETQREAELERKLAEAEAKNCRAGCVRRCTACRPQDAADLDGDDAREAGCGDGVDGGGRHRRRAFQSQHRAADRREVGADSRRCAESLGPQLNNANSYNARGCSQSCALFLFATTTEENE